MGDRSIPKDYQMGRMQTFGAMLLELYTQIMHQKPDKRRIALARIAQKIDHPPSL